MDEKFNYYKTALEMEIMWQNILYVYKKKRRETKNRYNEKQ